MGVLVFFYNFFMGLGGNIDMVYFLWRMFLRSGSRSIRRNGWNKNEEDCLAGARKTKMKHNEQQLAFLMQWLTQMASWMM